MRQQSLRRATLAGLLLLSPAITAIPCHSQGCAQCRDNTAATPPVTQKAYRAAIVLLGTAAVSVCSAAVLIARRFR